MAHALSQTYTWADHPILEPDGGKLLNFPHHNRKHQDPSLSSECIRIAALHSTHTHTVVLLILFTPHLVFFWQRREHKRSCCHPLSYFEFLQKNLLFLNLLWNFCGKQIRWILLTFLSLKKLKIPWEATGGNAFGKRITTSVQQSRTGKWICGVTFAIVLSSVLSRIEVGAIYLSLFLPSLPPTTPVFMEVRLNPSQVREGTVSSSESPKVTLICSMKSHVFGQVITGGIVFTLFLPQLHWGLVQFIVPFIIGVGPLLPPHKGIGRFSFYLDTFNTV